MNYVYASGQLSSIFPFIDNPKWLIVGGPDESNEVHTARSQWPDIKVIGIEPNPKAVQWQHGNGWPEDCPLIHAALSYYIGSTQLNSPDMKHGTIMPECIEHQLSQPHLPSDVTEVDTVTLDHLDEQYGPFEDAILWLDIEGAEHWALLGAVNLLRSGRVHLINVEMQPRTYAPHLTEEVDPFLKQYGYKHVDTRAIDYVYTLED